MKIAIILGTRPEIIKMSPIIRQLRDIRANFYILHTGQHYTYNLDKVFFENLEIPQPKYNLDVGSATHAEQTGKMLIGIEKTLQQENTDTILVEGDTNTVLAGALAASKLHIDVGHVEAGLRSFDRSMPEEVNRILTDHISDFLFAPTDIAKNNLIKEGIKKNKIYVTGNTIVDAVYQNLKIAERKVNILNKLNLKHKQYMLVTIHRQENADIKNRLKNIFNGLNLIFEEFQLPLIYPIHPRTLKKIKEFDLKIPKGVRLMDPIGFLEFLQLESNAFLVITDSGGIQEETCILKVPCVTLRDNTERPETLEVGSNILAGTEPNKIIENAKIMADKQRDWRNPFGDGKTSKQITDILMRENK